MTQLLRLDNYARERNMPIVRIITHDVMSVLTGRPIVVRDVDGNEVLVRLYTAEEWLPLQHAAVDKSPSGEKVDMARAVELTAPLLLPGWAAS